ncbi:hypothetical protein GCM10027511_16980 [Hymenobacter humi]
MGLLFAVLPAHAQYAFNYVSAAKGSSRSSAVEAPKASAYKLVHGVVQDANGALAGATVWLHGTRTIVVTNAEGEFELRVPADAKVVKLTCGYGGLQEEVVSMAPVKAMGSIYLLRTKEIAAN